MLLNRPHLHLNFCNEMVFFAAQTDTMKKLFLLAIPAIVASCGQTQQSSEQPDPMQNIVGTEVTYEGDSITMKGYVAYDASLTGPRPGVIVVHEWWGHNSHARNSADKLAKAGYVAFALDMYGDGKQVDHPKDAGAFASAVMEDFEGAKARFEAAMNALKSNPACDTARIAAIGYCFGGGIVLNLARQGADLDAVATFHGSIDPMVPATPGSVKGKILVMNGADDPFVALEAIEAFKAEMEAAGVSYEFVNYPGAVHAFTNPEATEKGQKFELPLEYNAKVDSLSWQKLEQFLGSVFN
jgi:dienelactone hydrolase